MREIFIYLIAALAGLTVLGYSVHMLVGGLVSRTTEYSLIAAACLLGAGVLAFMAWDVVRRRRSR